MKTNDNFIVIKSDNMTMYCSKSKQGYLSVHAIDENIKEKVRAHADGFLSEYNDKLIELKIRNELTLRTYSALFASFLLKTSNAQSVIIELSSHRIHVQCLVKELITNPKFDIALISSVEAPGKGFISSMIGHHIFTISLAKRVRLISTDTLNAIRDWINTGYDQCVKSFSSQFGPVLY